MACYLVQLGATQASQDFPKSKGLTCSIHGCRHGTIKSRERRSPVLGNIEITSSNAFVLH